MLQGDKKKIIHRLIDVPAKGKRPFWAREMKFLKDFMSEYPCLEFWQKVSFGKKLESFVLLKGEYGSSVLKKKYLEFNYVIPEKEEYNIGKKCGEDILINKSPKTIKDFVNNRFTQKT